MQIRPKKAFLKAVIDKLWANYVFLKSYQILHPYTIREKGIKKIATFLIPITYA